MKKLFTPVVAVVAILMLFNFSEAKAQNKSTTQSKQQSKTEKTEDPEFEELKKAVNNKLNNDTTFNAYLHTATEVGDLQLKVISTYENYQKEEVVLDSMQTVAAPLDKIKVQSAILAKAKIAEDNANKQLEIAKRKLELADKAFKAAHKEE